MSLPRLRGRLVELRPVTALHQSRVVAIRSTAEVARRWRGTDLAAEFAEDLADDELHQFVIQTADRHIAGLIQFAEEPDPDYRHASIDLFIDPSLHRRGLGADAVGTLVAYLLDERGHHRVVVDPAADNAAAIACYAKVGFTPVGVMRAYERRPDGTWADGLLMELLDTDPHVR